MPEANKPIIPDKRQTERGAIRLFFKDEKSGNPVAGMVVSIFVDSPGNTDSSTNQSKLIATLQTDQAGYVSFKFDRSVIATSTRLTVTHGASPRDARAFRIADLLAAGDTHTIRLDASALVPISTHPGLPSVMFPDVEDALLSPSSIGVIPQLAHGRDRGLCSQLMPTLMGIRRFRAFQILADTCHPKMVSCPLQETVQIVEGKMLEYEVTWNPAGAALGDLLNTITLAPCEEVNIAIIDWMRRETATLDQATEVQQESFQQMDHDRLITETMQSSVKSKSFAWGVAGTLSGKIPVTEEIDLTGTLGWGVSGTKTSQQIAAATSSKLSERITQAASFVASQRNSAVFQTTASEHRTYQTRTIRNHNHCHTLSLMYYQVNRNYQVVTEYKGERDVILIKYEIEDFDAERAYCNAEVLKPALLDDSLLGCFDELADALFCCDIKPAEPPPPANKDLLIDALRITVEPGEVQGTVARVFITLRSATGAFLYSTGVNTTWSTGGIHTVTFPISPPVDPRLVASIEIAVGGPVTFPPPPLPKAFLKKIDVTYHEVVNNAWFDLYSLHTGTTIVPGWQTPVTPQLPGQQPPTTVVKNECVEKSCCIQKLLGHLNCHKRYYNRVLWLNEDPNERIIRWSCCFKELKPFDLIGQIENDPVAVYGDYLVFQVAGSPLVDDPSILPVRELITMPTPGVYAEGILGQCDTCEIIDTDRFWDWKDSPCVDNAPAVDEPPAPQPGVKPGDLKPDLISNLITFSSVPGAPESVLKDLISTLVSNADSGSSEAKALLDKLLDTIKESLKPTPETPPKKSQ